MYILVNGNGRVIASSEGCLGGSSWVEVVPDGFDGEGQYDWRLVEGELVYDPLPIEPVGLDAGVERDLAIAELGVMSGEMLGAVAELGVMSGEVLGAVAELGALVVQLQGDVEMLKGGEV